MVNLNKFLTTVSFTILIVHLPITAAAVLQGANSNISEDLLEVFKHCEPSYKLMTPDSSNQVCKRWNHYLFCGPNEKTDYLAPGDPFEKFVELELHIVNVPHTFLRLFPNIRHLWITMPYEAPGDSTILPLADGRLLDSLNFINVFTKLEQIRIGRCNLSGRPLPILESRSLQVCQICCNLPNLVEGTFSKVLNLTDVQFLSNKSFTKLPKTIFLNNHKLRKVSFSDNRLSDVEGVFGHLHRLENLILSKNLLRRIFNETFNGCWSLKLLDLADNVIETVDLHAFHLMSELYKLDLMGNQLTRVELYLHTLVPVLGLKLLLDPLQLVDVSSSTSLNQLDLFLLVSDEFVDIRVPSGSRLSLFVSTHPSISHALFKKLLNLPGLESLNISGQTGLSGFNFGSVRSDSLKTLVMSRCGLTYINPVNFAQAFPNLNNFTCYGNTLTLENIRAIANSYRNQGRQIFSEYFFDKI